jgi:hypothetical protein
VTKALTRIYTDYMRSSSKDVGKSTEKRKQTTKIRANAFSGGMVEDESPLLESDYSAEDEPEPPQKQINPNLKKNYEVVDTIFSQEHS